MFIGIFAGLSQNPSFACTPVDSVRRYAARETILKGAFSGKTPPSPAVCREGGVCCQEACLILYGSRQETWWASAHWAA